MGKIKGWRTFGANMVAAVGALALGNFGQDVPVEAINQAAAHIAAGDNKAALAVAAMAGMNILLRCFTTTAPFKRD